MPIYLQAFLIFYFLSSIYCILEINGLYKEINNFNVEFLDENSNNIHKLDNLQRFIHNKIKREVQKCYKRDILSGLIPFANCFTALNLTDEARDRVVDSHSLSNQAVADYWLEEYMDGRLELDIEEGA